MKFYNIYFKIFICDKNFICNVFFYNLNQINSFFSETSCQIPVTVLTGR